MVEDEEAVGEVPVGEPDGDGGYGEDDEDYSEEGGEGGGEFVMFGGGVIGGGTGEGGGVGEGGGWVDLGGLAWDAVVKG